MSSTFQTFLQRAANVHGDTYEYPQQDLKRLADKLVIVCKKHGQFQQAANSHLNGRGCPTCGRKKATTPRFSLADVEKIIEDKHAGKFKVVELGRTKKDLSRLLCPVHGEFLQTVGRLSVGMGCKLCGYVATANSKYLTQDEALTRFRAKHGDKYDYSRVVYTGQDDKVSIRCGKHGEFLQRPVKHWAGDGCPKCGGESVSRKNRHDLATWEARARKVHGDRYTYEGIRWDRGMAVLTIRCGQHGQFEMRAGNHITRRGNCPTCSAISRDNAKRLDVDAFIARATAVHEGKYDYRQVQYDTTKDKVVITCREHGPFRQKADSHVRGSGCPKCRGAQSKAERDIARFLADHAEVQTRRKIPGSNLEMDIYLPEHKLAIEYHGLFFHSSRHRDSQCHSKKHKAATAAGLRLIQVFEDEWLDAPKVVQKTLLHAMGKSDLRVYARSCTVGSVADAVADQFLQENHIQGSVRGAEHLGLYLFGELVAVMSFTRRYSARGKTKSDGIVELIRYAAAGSVVGGASRLLKVFVTGNPDVREIVSFSDNRWFSGQMYERLGFKLDAEVQATYYYVTASSKTRMSKALFQRKFLPEKLAVFDPNLSERENCERNGLYQIHDAGKRRWLWTRI